MKATMVFPEHLSWVGDARIYRLDPPFEGFDHVAVTVFPVEHGQWQNAGVQVVGCNAEGIIPGDVVEAIFQSYVVMTHEEVIAELGYEIEGP